MLYFIAVFMFLGGFFFISIGRMSMDNVKNIRELLEDDKNRQEAKGNLQIIEIRRNRYDFECDAKLIFINHNGKTFTYNERFFASNSKAIFLREYENTGEIPVTVIYDKRLPSKHFIKECFQILARLWIPSSDFLCCRIFGLDVTICVLNFVII